MSSEIFINITKEKKEMKSTVKYTDAVFRFSKQNENEG